MLERGYVDPAEETDKVPFATNASGAGETHRFTWNHAGGLA
jgi:hypothetical protein